MSHGTGCTQYCHKNLHPVELIYTARISSPKKSFLYCDTCDNISHGCTAKQGCSGTAGLLKIEPLGLSFVGKAPRSLSDSQVFPPQKSDQSGSTFRKATVQSHPVPGTNLPCESHRFLHPRIILEHHFVSNQDISQNWLQHSLPAW